MEKNTILAVILSVIVITVGMAIQTTFFPPSEQIQTTEAASEQENAAAADETNAAEQNLSASDTIYVSDELAYNTGIAGSFKPADTNADPTPFTFSTDVYTVTFDPAGASVSSIKTNKYTTKGEPVELLFNTGERNAFLMYAGADTTNPITAVFNHEIKGNQVIFTQDFIVEGQKAPFTITKTYTFGDSDYLFSINVNIKNSENKVLPLSYESNAYTLAFEPQIGPEFETLSQDQYNYRRFYTKQDGSKKKKSVRMKNGMWSDDSTYSWIALTGKYFSVIAIPDATQYEITLTEGADEESAVSWKSCMYLTRPATRSAEINDTFRFYIGPQLKKIMSVYDHADENSFGLSGLQLEKALDSSQGLGWLEDFLMILLRLFYFIIPNYGVGIILITIVLKLVLYPLTKSSMQSSAKMQALQPKMQEIQKRYPNDPQKQNELMAELYRKEKINPIGGCIPMLIQFPILIAMYGLLNKHFELRDALFIPGWIPDLSQPDTVLTFPFHIPLLGNQLHLLPIIYTVSMIWSMKMTQTSGADSNSGMMKFMTWGMPLIFFFWLYNSPSGLMLYWTVMNVISVWQQKRINRELAKEQAQKKTGNGETLHFTGKNKKRK